ncbi:MAG: DMT family transporter [Firmicutes bacterium]|nr:DMT family transporter [Bacillota bacterium]
MFGLYLLLAFLGGVAVMFQVGVNSQLRNWVGHSVFAAFISFSIGALVLFFYILIQRVPWPDWSKTWQAPWWVWLGGALGAFYVWTTIVVAPKIGTAALMSLVVTGQMLISLTLDHFGLLGLARHPVNVWRLLGVLLLLLGVALIRGK